MTEPTDAEIEALGHRMCWRYKHDTGVNHISTFTFNAQTLHGFTRAVLAKWGTPAPVRVEPDAVGCRCSICNEWQRWTTSGMTCKNGHGGAAGVNQKLYTAAQVLATGRVPLTPEQRTAAFIRAEKKMQSDVNLSWRHALADEIEAAHGIKGGQHGAERKMGT